MSNNRPETVCIIPAYNEAKTVSVIATLAVNHPEIDRVIVIDDGSDDETSGIASTIPEVEVLRLDKNHGKGAAMRSGMDATGEPILLFLDADLIGLKTEHFSDLLKPVLHDTFDMSVGLFRGGRLHTDLAHIVAPSLSGQRAIRRSVLANLDMDSVGFGIERALNELWVDGSIKVSKVILHGVSHVTKEEKRGYLEGVKQRMGMYADILRFEGNRIKRKIGILNGNSHND